MGQQVPQPEVSGHAQGEIGKCLFCFFCFFLTAIDVYVIL